MTATVEILEQCGFHFLWINGELWMWDLPGEKEEQRRIAHKAKGDVLVVGYGLGIVQGFLVENPRVQSVTTFEKHQEVIDACVALYTYTSGNVFTVDFYKAVSARKYDTVIGDCWQEISPQYLPDYIRFKGTAEKFLRKDGQVLGWGRDFFEYLIERQGIES